MNIINEIDIGNELMEIIRRMRWENLFLLHLDVYEDLVYEFYSSLLVPTINMRILLNILLASKWEVIIIISRLKDLLND